MIIFTYVARRTNSQYNAVSTSSTYNYLGGGVTMGEILACCQSILKAIRGRAFIRETPSRKEIMNKIIQVQVETVDIRRELKQTRTRIGGKNADK